MFDHIEGRSVVALHLVGCIVTHRPALLKDLCPVIPVSDPVVPMNAPVAPSARPRVRYSCSKKHDAEHLLPRDTEPSGRDGLGHRRRFGEEDDPPPG